MTFEIPEAADVVGPDETIQAIGAVLRSMDAPPLQLPQAASSGELETTAPRFDTISVFPGWGLGLERMPDDDEMSSAQKNFWKSYMLRGKVNVEIRQTLEARGVRIVEAEDNGGKIAAPGEVVMNPRIDADALNEALPDITSEVAAVPSENFDTFMAHPRLPVLVYLEGYAGGVGKFAIDTPEQVGKIAQLFADRHWAKSQLGPLLKFKPIIETPSTRFTSFRVLVSSIGDILGSGLLYSPLREAPKKEAAVLPDPYYHSQSMLDYFTDPYSPYCLNGRNITSNISGGGGCIPLDPTELSRPLTTVEWLILEDHNMLDQQLLTPIRTAAEKIGKHLGGQGGLVYGLDFMLDTDGRIWFLEAGADPGMQTMNEVANRGKNSIEEGYRLTMRRAVDSVFPPR